MSWHAVLGVRVFIWSLHGSAIKRCTGGKGTIHKSRFSWSLVSNGKTCSSSSHFGSSHSSCLNSVSVFDFIFRRFSHSISKEMTVTLKIPSEKKGPQPDAICLQICQSLEIRIQPLESSARRLWEEGPQCSHRYDHGGPCNAASNER